MIRYEKTNNENAFLLVPETKYSLDFDFNSIKEKISKLKQIPFEKIYVFVPDAIIELFYEFIKINGIKPIGNFRQNSLTAFEF